MSETLNHGARYSTYSADLESLEPTPGDLNLVLNRVLRWKVWIATDMRKRGDVDIKGPENYTKFFKI